MPRTCPTVEHTLKGDKDVPCLRIGFRYVRGMRQATAEKIVSERQKCRFEGIFIETRLSD